MRSLLASPLGFLIGLSLGALGGGGSILAVPALVYGAGQTAKHATTTSLLLVSITSLLGLIPHLRAGRVRVVAGALFGLAGVGGSLLGSRWNKLIDANLLLLAFSGLMLVAAYAMWRRTRRPASAAAASAPGGHGRQATATPGGATGASLLARSGQGPTVRLAGAGTAAVVATAATPLRVDPRTVVKVLVAGTGVGLLTGFFGVGGGFVIMPALVLTLGFSMPEAVGTSLLVITINSAVAMSTRLGGSSIEWRTVIPFTVASLIGVMVGSRLAGRRDATQLQRWFVALLLVVAVYTAVRSGLALS